jgi:hypothetical protein
MKMTLNGLRRCNRVFWVRSHLQALGDNTGLQKKLPGTARAISFACHDLHLYLLALNRV